MGQKEIQNVQFERKRAAEKLILESTLELEEMSRSFGIKREISQDKTPGNPAMSKRGDLRDFLLLNSNTSKLLQA